MRCRNCGATGRMLFSVELAGHRQVEVILCGDCREDYEALDWIAGAEPAE
ncbi:MAG: hypothetical protein ABEI39_00945 [Halobacteriales archaeon]